MARRTAIFGYGRIAAGYEKDRRMAAAFEYPTHRSVLSQHPGFEVVAAIDPDEAARDAARTDGIPTVCGGVDQLPGDLGIEVAIIATPPGARAEILRALPDLQGVFVEKPIGEPGVESTQFVEECRSRDLVVQVNFIRRGDETLRELAAHGRDTRIGSVQAAFGLYGRGAYNTATHMTDLLRLLAGDAAWVQASSDARPAPDAALEGDVALAFTVGMSDNGIAMFAPLDYGHYREAALDLWGTGGRLAAYQEGLSLQHFPRVENRGLDDAFEIASDQPSGLVPKLGKALYRLYDNLDDALETGEPLWSGLDSALASEAIVTAAVRSARTNGARIDLVN